MAFKIEITEPAKQDIEKAISYYNDKTNGLAERFYKQFEEAIKKIKLHPHYYSYYKKPFRRILFKDFPYLVIYKIYENVIVVTGVLPEMIYPKKITDRADDK